MFLKHPSHLFEVGLLAGFTPGVNCGLNRLAQLLKEQVKALDVRLDDVELEQAFIL